MVGIALILQLAIGSVVILMIFILSIHEHSISFLRFVSLSISLIYVLEFSKFSSVIQSCPLFTTPWTAVHQASLSFNICQSLLNLVSVESVKPSNHLVLCHPLLILPSIFPSIRVFSNESALQIRQPKYWSFSISPSYSGLLTGWISLQSKGLFKNLLQHNRSNATILQCSAFFMVQLSHPYMIMGKTIALTRQTLVEK